MDRENHLEKTPIQKIEKKNSKNQSEIAACEQKTTSEKANFCSNPVFSLYFKFRAKKFQAAKPLLFAPLPVSAWPKSQLQFDFKNHENVWTDLKKKHSRQNSGTDSKRQNFTYRTVIAAEAITFCIKPLTHWLPRSDLNIG